MAIERQVKTIERQDGQARLFIMERDDGLYRFVGEAVEEEDGYRFWAPCDFSGLYQSADDAERAATQSVLWLRDQAAS